MDWSVPQSSKVKKNTFLLVNRPTWSRRLVSQESKPGILTGNVIKLLPR